jgi:hypothetical protein
MEGPTEGLDIMKEHSMMTNLPRLGSDGNYYWPAMQYNVASAKAATTGNLHIYKPNGNES